MCTNFLLINQIKNIPIALLINRDEFKSRKSKMIQVWDSNLLNYGNDIIAPRDEKEKGTWFGCQNLFMGKWGILTNIRDPAALSKDKKSRGEVIINYLNTNLSTKEYINKLSDISHHYNYFNIIFSDGNEIYYFNSKEKSYKFLHSYNNKNKIIYGLSNGSMESIWPKVYYSIQNLEVYLNQTHSQNSDFYWNYFKNFMQNKKTYDIKELPQTGVPIEQEVFYSSLFIEGKNYDTCSTIFFGIEKQEQTLFFYEQTYNQNSKIEEFKHLKIKYYDV